LADYNQENMNPLRLILSLWMVRSILFAGCLAKSVDFHAWLHDGKDFCHVKDAHYPDKGHVGHHHQGESAEEHLHGLLTLMAGAGMDNLWTPPLVPNNPESHWLYVVEQRDAPPVSDFLTSPPGRSPPAIS
jgi:hypothetical protein